MMPRDDAGRDVEPRNPLGVGGGRGLGFGAGIPALDPRGAAPASPRDHGLGEGAGRGPLERAAPPRAGLRGVLDRALSRADQPTGLPGPVGALLERAAAAYTGPRAPGPLRPALERAETDPVLSGARVYARRVHWAEDPAGALADVLVVAAAGTPVVLLGRAAVLDPYRDAFAPLGLGDGRLHLEPDEHLDALRTVAARPEVTVDAPFPESGTIGSAAPQAQLLRLRSEAAAAPREDTPAGWFGAGVVAPPPAPLRLGTRFVRVARVGIDGPAAPGEDTLDLPADPGPAAAAVLDAAFGPGVLGGHAPDAVRRVLVDRAVFSVFTAALLEALAEGLADGTLGAPAWALGPPGHLTRHSDPALAAARRVGLDEGATLIHEERRPGQQLVVFTNVEPRMALGSALVAPCVLSLMRSG